MTRLFSAAFAILLALSVFSIETTAAAQDAAAEGAIKYRKAVMKAVGGNMGAIVGIMKGQGSPANLTTHSNAMSDLSAIAVTLFPDGSDFGETTALPVIWEKPEDFSAAMRQFQTAAANMSIAAASGQMDVAGAALGELGKSCKNCHENFREKKEKK